MSLLGMLAAVDAKVNPSDIGIDPVTNPESAISGVLATAYVAAGVVCVVIIIVAGYLFVTSSGDPSTTKRAREALIGAVVGIIVILMAFTITNFVLGRF